MEVPLDSGCEWAASGQERVCVCVRESVWDESGWLIEEGLRNVVMCVKGWSEGG